MTAHYLTLGDVARILTLIVTRPNSRRHPGPQDLAGDFDEWFDGGAVKIVTGFSTYRFTDGAEATTTSSPGVNALIRFPSGREVAVSEKWRPFPPKEP